MTTFTIVGVLLAIILLTWAVWLVIGGVRNNVRDKEELDERLRSVCR